MRTKLILAPTSNNDVNLIVPDDRTGRWILIAASLLGGLAVLLGAFGGHSLQLDATQTDWFETASRYHFYHALALLVLGILPIGYVIGNRWLAVIAICWYAGVVLFSGSLYFAATGLAEWFWLTPVGGLLLIAGWFMLLVQLLRSLSKTRSS